MPSHIQTSRFAEQCCRLFGVRGLNSSECLDDIFPSLNILDPEPSVRFLRGDHRYVGAVTTPAAGAGVYSWASLSNPPGSGKLIVVDALQAWAAAASLGTWYVESASGGATPGTLTALDSRAVRGTASAAAGFSGTGANVGSALGTAYFPLGTTLADLFPVDAVLLPDSRILLCHVSANTAFNVQFYWSERPLMVDEL